MSDWLMESAAPGASPAPAADAGVDRRLRQIDVTLALCALLVLGLPYLWARGLGRLMRTPMAGLGGRRFERLRLQLPDTRCGRLMAALGASGWPVLFNILRGDMAWVGPAAQALTPETAEVADAVDPKSVRCAVRPGVLSLWSIRRRAAVAFSTEEASTLDYLAGRGVKHDIGVLVRGAFVTLFAAPQEAGPGRVLLCDVCFDNVDMGEALGRIDAMLDASTPSQVSFVNPACVNIAAGQRGYRRALARAALVLPDGIGTKIAADLLGTPLKQNVNGTDLFPRLCDRLEARGARLFLLGGQPEVVQRVADVVRARWPAIHLVGVRDGFFTTAQEGEVAAQVRASGADIMLVARGVPMQDIFIDRYLHHFGVKVSVGVGGLFDFVSGRISRAPRWMREAGLEWIWRLLQEPGRMWRRYLIGNFTFLARVLLQRLRLRQPHDDSLPEPDAAAVGADERVVGVLFANAGTSDDIPAEPDFPAALLPCGPTTFIERGVAQLVQAGVRHIHIVATVRPDLLRSVLGQGERWGVRLTWHLTDDLEHAAQALRLLRLHPQQRVVIGCAHRCIASSAVARLVEIDQRALVPESPDAALWSGWASVPAHAVEALARCDSALAFELAICESEIGELMLRPEDYGSADSAAELLVAQVQLPAAEVLAGVTEAWIAMPWGAMSPQAHVSPQAKVQGPAWIGAGCVVAPGAEIGPHAVLVRDVIVSPATTLRNCVVLAHTFVGQGLELRDAIANGASVQHVALRARNDLVEADGILTSIRPATAGRGVLIGRALALATVLLAAPLVAIDLLLRQLTGQALPWRSQEVVAGRNRRSGAWHIRKLRVPRSGLSRVATAVAVYGQVLDIAGGQRRWFGVRPRSPAEWRQLPPDWRAMLNDAPLGLLHLGAWGESKATGPEVRAAADLMWLSRPRGWRVLPFALRAVRATGSTWAHGVGPNAQGSMLAPLSPMTRF